LRNKRKEVHSDCRLIWSGDLCIFYFLYIYCFYNRSYSLLLKILSNNIKQTLYAETTNKKHLLTVYHVHFFFQKVIVLGKWVIAFLKFVNTVSNWVYHFVLYLSTKNTRKLALFQKHPHSSYCQYTSWNTLSSWCL
jgi:hypothetical protein